MSPKPVNRTTYAILGLLTQGPKSGYDIKREAETTISHFWKESFGHIYPVLRRLHEAGWVDRTTEAQTGKPDRHVYHITPAGRAALQSWLREPVEPVVTRNELLLKLFFGEQVEPFVIRAHIATYRQHHEALLAGYQARHADVETDPAKQFKRLTLLAGIHYCESVIAWCDEASTSLSD